MPLRKAESPERKNIFSKKGRIIMGRMLLAVSLACFALALGADSLKLQLPEKIYAVPGLESNIYFDNIVLTPNSDVYVFDVTCKKGRNDQKRWRFVPSEKDVGEYDWSVKVMDGNGTLAEGRTKLIVSPADAGKGKTVSILVVGDSLTAANVYPIRLFELAGRPGGNPRLKMIGSSGPNRQPQKNGVAHEGWGGWTWKTFISKTKPSAKKDPKPWDVPSRFLVVKDGKGKLDFQAYLDKYNGGKAPDFITVQLGVNDIFGATDENADKKIKDILQSADTLLAEFRRVAPKAKIGIGLVTPSARSQDAFGSNYACGQTRWQYRKNQHRLNEAYLKKFTNHPDKNISVIPTNINLDCENNFPVVSEAVNLGSSAKITRQCNGVHPASPGYRQIGDTFYCWLKYQLNSKAR